MDKCKLKDLYLTELENGVLVRIDQGKPTQVKQFFPWPWDAGTGGTSSADNASDRQRERVRAEARRWRNKELLARGRQLTPIPSSQRRIGPADPTNPRESGVYPQIYSGQRLKLVWVARCPEQRDGRVHHARLEFSMRSLGYDEAYRAAVRARYQALGLPVPEVLRVPEPEQALAYLLKKHGLRKPECRPLSELLHAGRFDPVKDTSRHINQCTHCYAANPRLQHGAPEKYQLGKSTKAQSPLPAMYFVECQCGTRGVATVKPWAAVLGWNASTKSFDMDYRKAPMFGLARLTPEQALERLEQVTVALQEKLRALEPRSAALERERHEAFLAWAECLTAHVDTVLANANPLGRFPRRA